MNTQCSQTNESDLVAPNPQDLIQFNRQLASKTGSHEDGTWSELYDHHLGSVQKPFPFVTFRNKYNLLANYLKQDPDGHKPHLDKPIAQLSRELGL